MQITAGITTTSGETYNIAATFVHPTYDASVAVANRVDMAILQVVGTITFGPEVGSIALASANCTTCAEAGAIYTVSGYGNTQSTVMNGQQVQSDQSTTLQFVQQQWVSPQTCQNVAPFTLPATVICAGPITGQSNTDACTGDSGGPLAQNTASGWVLVGLVQTGTVGVGTGLPLCGASGNFGIYTSIAENSVWINSVLAGQVAPTDNTSGGGSGGNSLSCFHRDTLVSYKGQDYVPISNIQAGASKDCLVPHEFESDGVSIATTCHSSPLRLTANHLVFSKTHGLVAAGVLRAGDVVYGDEAETKLCTVTSVAKERKQVYMGLNCHESVVVANGVKSSTFEDHHTVPALWMKWVSSVVGLPRASRWGEALSNVIRKTGLA